MSATAPIILWQNLIELNGIDVVSSEDADFPKENMLDWRTFTSYKSTASGTVTIDVDMGGVLSNAPDAFAMGPNNLKTASADITITSTSNADYTTGALTRLSTQSAASDNIFYYDLTSASGTEQFWRFSIANVTGSVADISIMALGAKFQFAKVPIDPFDLNQQGAVGRVNLSRGGALLGASIQNPDRRIRASFRFLTAAQAALYEEFFVLHGRLLKPFFLVPDQTNFASRVYLVRYPDNPRLLLPSQGIFRHLDVEYEGPLLEDF